MGGKKEPSTSSRSSARLKARAQAALASKPAQVLENSCSSSQGEDDEFSISESGDFSSSSVSNKEHQLVLDSISAMGLIPDSSLLGNLSEGDDLTSSSNAHGERSNSSLELERAFNDIQSKISLPDNQKEDHHLNTHATNSIALISTEAVSVQGTTPKPLGTSPNCIALPSQQRSNIGYSPRDLDNFDGKNNSAGSNFNGRPVDTFGGRNNSVVSNFNGGAVALDSNINQLEKSNNTAIPREMRETFGGTNNIVGPSGNPTHVHENSGQAEEKNLLLLAGPSTHGDVVPALNNSLKSNSNGVQTLQDAVGPTTSLQIQNVPIQVSNFQMHGNKSLGGPDFAHTNFSEHANADLAISDGQALDSFSSADARQIREHDAPPSELAHGNSNVWLSSSFLHHIYSNASLDESLPLSPRDHISSFFEGVTPPAPVNGHSDKAFLDNFPALYHASTSISTQKAKTDTPQQHMPRQQNDFVKEGSQIPPSQNNWKDFFVGNLQSSLKLDFFPSDVSDEDGEPIACPPKEVYDEGNILWDNCLIGQFIGKPPPFFLIETMVNNQWKKFGHVDIKSTDKGLYVFSFENSSICDVVLEELWHVNHRPLLLRKWDPDIQLVDFKADRVPLWMKLKNVPISLWTRAGLNYVASTIGYTLQMDSVTTSRNHLRYARVCIEVNLEKPLKDTTKVKLRNGQIALIDIEYAWKPQRCSHCSIIGHSSNNCPTYVPITNDSVDPLVAVAVESKDSEWQNGSKKKRNTKRNKNRGAHISNQNSETLSKNQYEILSSNENANAEATASKLENENHHGQKKTTLKKFAFSKGSGPSKEINDRVQGKGTLKFNNMEKGESSKYHSKEWKPSISKAFNAFMNRQNIPPDLEDGTFDF